MHSNKDLMQPKINLKNKNKYILKKKKTQPYQKYGMQQKQFLEGSSEWYMPSSKNRKISNKQPNLHIKALEKEEQTKPKVSRRKEIIKIREEINKIEIKNNIKKLVKPRAGLPWWCSGWESACQCRGHGFDPWSGKIPHATEQLGPWATTTEPARLEPVLRNKRGRDSERPAHRDEEWPPPATTRESPRTEMKTQHSQK